MRSSVPKVLHPICGRPIVAWPVLAAREAGARAVAVATGFADLDALRACEPDALLQDLSDTEAAIRAITAST